MTWKYGSDSNLTYRLSTSCCHNNVLQLFPALAKSQSIGSANCLRGEPASMTRFNKGIMPACAASSWRDLFSRQRLKHVWNMWLAISYKPVGVNTWPQAGWSKARTVLCGPWACSSKILTRISMQLAFCRTSSNGPFIERCLIALSMTTKCSASNSSHARNSPNSSQVSTR